MPRDLAALVDPASARLPSADDVRWLERKLRGGKALAEPPSQCFLEVREANARLRLQRQGTHGFGQGLVAFCGLRHDDGNGFFRRQILLHQFQKILAGGHFSRMGEADEHHFCGKQGLAGVTYLGNTFQQHLPGARQVGHAKARRVVAAA